MRPFVWLVFLVLTTQACRWSELGLGEDTDDIGQETTSEKASADAASPPSPEQALAALELKQARMWARLDELEGLVLRQKEKISLLEQGLLLGIMPEKLAKDVVAKDNQEAAARPSPSQGEKKRYELAAPSAQAGQGPQRQSLPPQTAAANKGQTYKERLAGGQKLFQQGRFGKAYLEFSQLEREFPISQTLGEPRYWLGRCWYQLKEYTSAEQAFSAFISDFPASPWQSSAKFYLANVELAEGKRDLAVKRLQDLIRDHPYEASSEAAKQLLQRMANAL